MKIILLAALSKNGVIGRRGTLPWRLPRDLRHFKRNSLGKPLIMGRKTYNSIGRPLPKRTNIILTRDTTFEAAGCLIAHSAEQALQLARQQLDPALPDVIIAGGTAVYAAFMPHATHLWLTHVDVILADGDAYMPPIDWQAWRVVQHEHFPVDERHAYAHEVALYERRHKKSGSA